MLSALTDNTEHNQDLFAQFLLPLLFSIVHMIDTIPASHVLEERVMIRPTRLRFLDDRNKWFGAMLGSHLITGLLANVHSKIGKYLN